MKTHFYTSTLLYLTILLLAISGIANAQWSSDPNENNPVVVTDNDQKEPSVVTTPEGGVIIAWRDYRFTESIFGGEIYAQKMDSSGHTLWTANGMGVNYGLLNKGQFSPLMVKDGKGGAVVVWERNALFFYNYDILAQRVNSAGERLWAYNDVVIADTSGTKSFHQVTSDQKGGAVVVWSYLPGTPGSTNIYAQRIDSSGNTLWRKNGEEICMAAESQSFPNLATDGHGGAFIIWDDNRSGEMKIYAQHIDSAGNVVWQTDGIEVSDQVSHQSNFGVISDQQGGAIVVWINGSLETPGLFVQRISETGELEWGTSAVKIAEHPFWDQFTSGIVSDDNEGVIVVWDDQRNNGHDIYAQRVNGNGEIVWTENGVPVCVKANNQLTPAAVKDGAGGVIAVWQDYRTDDQGDIYAQRLDETGTALWQTNGIAISTATEEQAAPIVASDGNEGAIFIWQDKRNGTDYDIYAQHVGKEGHFGESEDEDDDGILNEEEQGPDGTDVDYDGNQDGTPDSQQSNVASFHSYDQQSYLTLSVPDSVFLENVSALTNPAPDAPGIPAGALPPYGFIGFTITGLTPGSHTVATLLLPGDTVVNHYYKYGPVPGESAQWYEFSYDGETGAVINTDTILLYLGDGKRGDHDVTANGIIVDPGGPVLVATAVAPGEKIDPLHLQCFPNPTSDKTTVVFHLSETVDITLDLYDLTGKVVRSLEEGKHPAGTYTLTLLTSEMHEGIYLLRLKTGKHSVVQKMVVSR